MALNPTFNIQWHITNRCGLRCRHCYLRGRNKALPTELGLDQCRQVVDSFVRAAATLRAQPTVDLTGGDPLLCEHFWELFAYLREKKIRVSILGNPCMLNASTIERLKAGGLHDYQLSIDGLEKNHDWLRKKGSFAANMAAFQLLKEHQVSSGMMFTLTRRNRNDLLPVMRLAAELGHRAFAFDTLSPVGPKDECEKIMLSPLELRDTYKQYLAESQRLGLQGYKTVFTRKNHLYALIMEEKGLLHKVQSDQTTFFMGCPIGKGLIINSEGSVLPCPRIPIPIGNVPESEILDILLHSELLTKFRDRKNHRVCGTCSLFQYCRGCRASAWGVSGDIFGPDPYCWKSHQTENTAPAPEPAEPDGSKRMEEIMGIYYGWDYQPKLKYDPRFQEILGRALRDKTFLKRLTADPAGTCRDYGYPITERILFELGRMEFDSFFDILKESKEF